MPIVRDIMQVFVGRLLFDGVTSSWFEDPDASTIPVTQLLSKEYAVQRAKSIDMRRAAQHVVAGEFVLNRRETTYLCCADADGMMVSLIQSNYTGHGSGYCCAGFGLQNRGALFALQDGSPVSSANLNEED